MNRPQAWTYPLLLFGVIGLSFSSIFIRSLEHSGVPLLVVASYRMVLATLLLFPVFLAQRRREKSGWPAGSLVLAGLCLAIHFGAWNLSFQYLSIARSVVIVDSQPFFVTVAAYFILRERMSWKTVAGVIVAFGGLVILCFGSLGAASVNWRGDALALAGAIAIAGYLLIGRRLRGRLGLFAYVVPVYAVSAVVLLACAAMMGNSLAVVSGNQWLALLGLAAVPTLCGHTVMNWLLRFVPATIVSLTFLFEPFFAAALAYWFFAETPATNTVSGGIVIFAGIVLTVLGGKNENLSQQERRAEA